MKVAVEGCAHGELETIYETIAKMEEEEHIKVDLLICCGDFQSTRNIEDLRCMAVPRKYQSMCSFYKYYSGEKMAPMLTIFIGGNHEASNYLQELPYGGWVAPNIYYMGYASIMNVCGIRIAGLSGIYKGHDYMKGHFEIPPYTEETKRSVYHIRNLEIFRFKQVQKPIDIFLSHDWPRGIHQFGDVQHLLKLKPFFRNDINSGTLGSRPCEELLHELKPTYWFSAHLHVKFSAVVPHNTETKDNRKETQFLALDKCLPRRKFLQILDIPHDDDKSVELEYDLEWLTIVFLTNHLLSVKRSCQYMPGPGGNERWIFSPSPEEMELVHCKFNNNLCVPLNFTRTVSSYNPRGSQPAPRSFQRLSAQINPQTTEFCKRLGVDDPVSLIINRNINTTGLNTSSIVCSPPCFLTPDKSNDVTNDSFDFIGTSDVDSTPKNSGNSYFSKRFASPECNYTPIRRLSLPSPKASDSQLLSPEKRDVEESLTINSEESSNLLLTDNSHSVSIHTPECSEADEQPSNSSDILSMSDIQGVTSTPVPGDYKPQVKKFKRRNYSLYSSLDEN